jgi:hypothetical protein
LEESDLDLMQQRKVVDFKRMLLASLAADEEVVGLPVPQGYDDLLDVESWPLLQSFAADSLVGPSGFFSARFGVQDVSEALEQVLFRSVDGHCLDAALEIVDKTVGPHMEQFLRGLEGASPEQRRGLTGEEAIGPLEILFEFGEMEAVAGKCDPNKKPVVLFGADTAEFGASSGSNDGESATDEWRQKCVGDSLHCVLEACEPSTGIR